MKKYNFPQNATTEEKWRILNNLYNWKKNVVGKIISFENNYLFTVDLGGINAELFISDLSATYIKEPDLYIGKSFLFYLLKVDSYSSTIRISRISLATKLINGSTTNGIITYTNGNHINVDVGFNVSVKLPDSFTIPAEQAFKRGQLIDIVLLEDYKGNKYTKGSSSPIAIWYANIQDLKNNDLKRVEILDIRNNGLIVAFKDYFDIFISESNLTTEYRKRLKDNAINVTEQIDVAVTDINSEKHRVNLSMKRANQIFEERAAINLKTQIEVDSFPYPIDYNLNNYGFNDRQLYPGRYYGTSMVRHNNKLYHIDIILGPDLRIYYHNSSKRTEIIKFGDLVLFSHFDNRYEVYLLIPIRNAVILKGHNNSDSKAIHNLKFWFNNKKFIPRPHKSFKLEGLAEERFTEDEIKKINSSKTAIIIPDYTFTSIYLSLFHNDSPRLFEIDKEYRADVECFIEMLSLIKLREVKSDFLIKEPYNPIDFYNEIRSILHNIEQYVDGIDLNKIEETYKVNVESHYRQKIGGDDSLWGNYVASCDVEFDTYLKTFFPLPEGYYDRGYCNLYSCDTWRNYKRNATIIQERNINNFKQHYNRVDHISTLLYEKVSEPFYKKRRLIDSINDIDINIIRNKSTLENNFPLHIFQDLSFLFTSRDDLIEIVLAFNNRDCTNYGFNLFKEIF